MEKVCFIKSNNGDNSIQKAFVIKKGTVFEEKCSTSEFASAKNITWSDCSIAYDDNKDEFVWFVYHNGQKSKDGNELYNYPYMTDSIQNVVTANSQETIYSLSKSKISAEINGKEVNTFEIPSHVIRSKKRKRDAKSTSAIEKICSCPLPLLKLRISKHCHDVANFCQRDIVSLDYNPSSSTAFKRMIPVHGQLFEYIEYYIKKKASDRGLKQIRGEPIFEQFPDDMKEIIFNIVEKKTEDTWEEFHNKLSAKVLSDEKLLCKYESFVKTALNLYGNYIF